MLVYRVEDKEGKGPYRIDSELWIDARTEHPRCHPMPSSDIPEWNKTYCNHTSRIYVFGFHKYDHLISWFSDRELNKLFKLGFVIATYNVDEDNVLIGRHQVAFIKG